MLPKSSSRQSLFEITIQVAIVLIKNKKVEHKSRVFFFFCRIPAVYRHEITLI